MMFYKTKFNAAIDELAVINRKGAMTGRVMQQQLDQFADLYMAAGVTPALAALRATFEFLASRLVDNRLEQLQGIRDAASVTETDNKTIQHYKRLEAMLIGAGKPEAFGGFVAKTVADATAADEVEEFKKTFPDRAMEPLPSYIRTVFEDSGQECPAM